MKNDRHDEAEYRRTKLKQKRRYTNRLCNDILPLFIVIVLEIRQYSRVLCLD